MATLSHAVPESASSALAERQRGIPWYIWCAVLAITSSMIGAHWDVSWHSSIGRDTFWTPAHMAIYLCGVLAGVAFGYLILSTTFSPASPLRDASVRIWGFRGPLGAFIASWGGITMLTSAPFDNWWHNAYGLDVQIVSPPHMVLFIGVYAVLFGTLVLIAGHANRSMGAQRRAAQYLMLYVAGIGLIEVTFMIMEFTSRSFFHTSRPYIAISLLAPIIFGMAARATSHRYAATICATVYTLALIGFILILPLFPAEPKLGPVYQHVTQFIPPQFPMLLIVPALALDFLWSRVRTRGWNLWLLSGVSAVAFLSTLLLVQWPFADFLTSPAARNRFFGTMYLWYGMPPQTYTARYLLYPEASGTLLAGLAVALVAAFFAFRIGISRGDWLERVKR